MEHWLPSLEACRHLRWLKVQYDTLQRDSNAPSVWQVLVWLAPRLRHLTTLCFDTVGGSSDSIRTEPLPASALELLPVPCFPLLHTLDCTKLSVRTAAQWRLLAACPSLADLDCVAANVALPPDLGQLGLTRLEMGLCPGWVEAWALLPHCRLLEEVVLWVESRSSDTIMPQVRAGTGG